MNTVKINLRKAIEDYQKTDDRIPDDLERMAEYGVKHAMKGVIMHYAWQYSPEVKKLRPKKTFEWLLENSDIYPMKTWDSVYCYIVMLKERCLGALSSDLWRIDLRRTFCYPAVGKSYGKHDVWERVWRSSKNFEKYLDFLALLSKIYEYCGFIREEWERLWISTVNSDHTGFFKDYNKADAPKLGEFTIEEYREVAYNLTRSGETYGLPEEDAKFVFWKTQPHRTGPKGYFGPQIAWRRFM